MDKQETAGERTGRDVLPDADTTGTNEKAWRETAEQAPETAGEQARPGGDERGRTSEGTKSGRARALRRAHHAGRVRDELGGVLGKVK